MFLLYLLILGMSGITAQVVLLRSFLTTAQGNEMAIGVIFGIWVIGESLGAFLLRKSPSKNPWTQFFLFNSLFAILFPFSLLFLFLSRKIFGFTLGEVILLPHLFLLSLSLIFPLSFLHGALFVISARTLSLLDPGESIRPISKTYVLENAGTIIGGLLLYFFLIPHLTPFQISFLFASLNFLILCFLRLRIHFSLFFLFFTILFSFEGKLRQPILSLWWGKERIFLYENTQYGNITVTEQEGEYTLFYDGFPFSILPNPEVSSIEDLAHFSLLAHPQPKNCLLIGQGFGGLIREVLKHPIENLDYLELDPKLIALYQRFPLSKEELAEKRVRVFYEDGRRFLASHPEKRYDIIIINHSLPLTLNANRYFTKEFYLECRKRLRDNGVLITLSPSSLTYFTPPLQNLIRIHLHTLKNVFPFVYFIPGEFNIYIAEKEKKVFNPDTFSFRWERRGIETKIFSPEYLRIRLNPYYFERLEEIVSYSPPKEVINEDLSPKGFLRSLSYLTSLSSLRLSKFYQGIEGSPFLLYLLFPTLLFLFTLISGFSQRRRFVPFILFATGFWGMGQSILLISLFQIRFGYVFNRITLLLTFFMLGSAIGGFVSLLTLIKFRKNYLLLLINESAILFFSLLMIILIKLPITGISGEILLFLSSLLSGLLLGFQFPISNALYQKEEGGVEPVGVLFAVDLIGGAVGAFLTSLFLIPVFGIIPLQTFIILIKSFSMILSILLLTTGIR